MALSERKKASNKAARLRKKQAEGKELSGDELAFLESHVPGKRGRPKKAADEPPPTVDHWEADGAESSGPGAPDDGKSDESAESKPKLRLVPPEPASRPETPPSVLGSMVKSGKPSAWQEKYRLGVGREATCLQGAVLLCSLMERACDFITEKGSTPIISKDQFGVREVDGKPQVGAVFASTVLLIDSLLPGNLELSPEVTVSVCAGLVLGQAYYVKKKAPAEPKKAEIQTDGGAPIAAAPKPEPPAPLNERPLEPILVDPPPPAVNNGKQRPAFF